MQLLSGDARRAVFAPLDDGALRSEAVVRRVGSAIALGLLGDGEQLPAETDLATMLNVSTVTLRDALAELRELGLVETRRGRGGGSFVRARDDALAELADARLAELGTTDLRELGDAHGAVAATAARLAAGRASVHEIARLRDIVDRLAAAPTTTGAAPRRRPLLHRAGRRGALGPADHAGDGPAPGARAAAVAAGARAGAARRDRRRPPRRPRRRRDARPRAGPRPHRGARRPADAVVDRPAPRAAASAARTTGPAPEARGPTRSAGRAVVTDVVERVFACVADLRDAALAALGAECGRRGPARRTWSSAPGELLAAPGQLAVGLGLVVAPRPDRRRPAAVVAGRPGRRPGRARCGRTCGRPASTSTTTRRPSGSTSPGGPGGGTSSVRTSTCTARGATC